MKKLLTKLNRFAFLGLALAYSQDVIPPFKYSLAKNIRSYKKGVIETRPGMTPINSTPVAAVNINSIIRLNDDTPSAVQSFARIVAASNGQLYSDNPAHNAFTSRSSGYSGNPLTFAVFRPNNTPAPYLYTGDSLKNEKINVAGTVSKMGITPPAQSPSAAIVSPARTTIDSLRATTGWATGGTASARATTSSSTTITNILYDVGNTGWASIQPNVITNTLREGSFVQITNGGAINEVVVCEQVIKAIKTTTIGSITYDSGSTGLCTIVLSAASRKGLVKDALISIAGEIVRVQSVTIGDDDTKSFRCSTTINHTAGQAVTGLDSIRVYLANTYNSATGTVNVTVLTMNCASGTSYITKTSSLDLSNVSGRELQDSDEMNLIVTFDRPDLMTEVQLLLDCDQSANDFTQNYFIKTFRPNDYDPVTTQTLSTQTTEQAAIQADAIDSADVDFSAAQEKRDRLQRKLQRLIQEGADPTRIADLERRINKITSRIIKQTIANPIYSNPTVAPAGVSQTMQLRFKISDLRRIGADPTVGLKDVKTLRLQAIVTGVVVMQFTGWWIGGSYGADVAQTGAPYIYRYNYRSKSTGAKSYPSPPMRSGVLPRRDRIALTPIASSDTQVDAIDWYRFGGSIEDWHYIGTGANSSATFNDDFPDDVVATKPILKFNGFVPFPVADLPRQGVVNVSGTRVTRVSGDSYNTKWAEGSVAIIDGVRCTLYGSPSNTTVFEINQNIGTKSNVILYMPEPIIAGTPMPAIWSSMEGDKANVIFGCGDNYNAGTLYYTNPDDPDSASDRNFLEVCPPTEPLMNGFVYDSRSFVWSSDNLYLIYPSPKPDGSLGFTSNITPLSKGIAGRYAFCIGEGAIWFVDRDGIYYTNGSQPTSITDEDLYPLFPHDGQVGAITNGISPPNFSQPDSLRLSIGDSTLRFDYLDTGSNRCTLLYNIIDKSWVLDSYTPDVVTSYFEQGRLTHNWLLGAADGRLYLNSGQGDGASSNSPIMCQVRTKAEDTDSPRSRKLWGDGSIEFETSNIALGVTATIGFDNYSTLLAPQTILATAINTRTLTPLEINNGSGQYAKNITLDLTWSSGTASIKLYNWSFSYEDKEEDTRLRATPADDLGYQGNKFIQGFRITANTYGVAKTFKIQADNGINGAWQDIQTFTMTTQQEATQAFSFEPPFTAHNVRIIGSDIDDWSLSNYEFIYNPEPEAVLSYTTQPTTHDLEGYQHIKDAFITLLSNAQVDLAITVDGVTYTYPIATTGGVKQKVYLIFKAIKGKYFTYSFTSSSGFRLYERDSLVNVHDWKAGQYVPKQPFGHPTRVTGNEALI